MAFCVGGYEHIIANMYTLQAGLMLGAPVSISDVVVFNFLPTLLGNIVSSVWSDTWCKQGSSRSERVRRDLRVS